MQSFDKYVFFWKPPSIYSQWTPSKFVINGIEYCCAEQYMMSEKAKLFEDVSMFNQIMATNETVFPCFLVARCP
uniref:NADAR domain-containing protein n=1 Tax=Pyramimonas orientalis virus TaxID=455367 RepID=A0A7L9AY26_POV01|nr:hypothetical protein HWQ62_00458 [Pyramimonas orientalis virus]